MIKKLTVYCYDHLVLRKQALPVEEITPEIVSLAQQMIDTMVERNGVGLSATQVGVMLRMFVKMDSNSTRDCMTKSRPTSAAWWRSETRR